MSAEEQIIQLEKPIDPIWIQTLGHLLREEATRGATIVFSTHQLDVVAMLANEVWMMKSGTISGKVIVEDERVAQEELRRFFFESGDATCQMDAARTK